MWGGQALSEVWGVRDVTAEKMKSYIMGVGKKGEGKGRKRKILRTSQAVAE